MIPVSVWSFLATIGVGLSIEVNPVFGVVFGVGVGGVFRVLDGSVHSP